MERKGAVALLKELMQDQLVYPTLVSLEQNKVGQFDIMMRVMGDTQALKQFVGEKNLMLEENPEKCYRILSRP